MKQSRMRDEICEYIARNNSKAASKLFDDIRKKCKLVADFPNMGKNYGRLARLSTRICCR